MDWLLYKHQAGLVVCLWLQIHACTGSRGLPSQARVSRLAVHSGEVRGSTSKAGVVRQDAWGSRDGQESVRDVFLGCFWHTAHRRLIN